MKSTNPNQILDHLIPEVSTKLTEIYFKILESYPEFNKNDIDTSPLLNLTLSVFITSTRRILNAIKKNTIGEIKLIENIELTEKAIIQMFKDLPFVSKIETAHAKKIEQQKKSCPICKRPFVDDYEYCSYCASEY